MRWDNERRSDNVEDQRLSSSQSRGALGAAPVLLRLLPFLIQNRWGRGLLILGAAVYFGAKMLGIDIAPMLLGSSTEPAQPAQQEVTQDPLADFVSVILASTEDTWQGLFQKSGQQYQPPKLVLFRNAVQSACGYAEAAMGPFYCPGDQKLYIDLSFYQIMKTRLGAPGDFAQAYVIAHEVGHHVQYLLGINAKVEKLSAGLSEVERNRLSVKQELQADCFAGIWGFYAKQRGNFLETGDLEEALTAASAIGDDRLQSSAGRTVRPESFTHGSAKERVAWFNKGFNEGSVGSCNTFNVQ
ncbi:MAG TPA: neutral zinc metallopeptidase [Cellvibrionaceae bacterium]